jgi:molybdopterin converting factor small subunit
MPPPEVAMTVTIQIPSSLQAYSGCAQQLSLAAATVGQALAELKDLQPALYISVCDETGSVRRHINLFVNSQIVCFRDPQAAAFSEQDSQGFETPLKPGDVLSILPAVSGG